MHQDRPHEIEVPGNSRSKTIEDNDAYTTDPLYLLSSEDILGTLDTTPKEVLLPTQTRILSCQLAA